MPTSKLKNIFTYLLVIAALTSCDGADQIEINDVQCIGHRGHVIDAIVENSMGSFISAYNIGADGTELDIYHTKDDIAVVFHDAVLSKNVESKTGMNCSTDLGISDFYFDDLAANCMLTNGDDIPKLEDVFFQFHDANFSIYIEFKDAPAQKTLDLINQYYADDLSRIKATVFLKDFLKNPFSDVYDPEFDLLVANSFYVQGLEHGFSGVDVGAISNDNIKRLQYFGKKVGLYGVNTAEGLEQAFDMRVNYITTDNLDECVQIKQRLL